MRLTSGVRFFSVFLVFVGLALVQAWPLPLHLGTHLTGAPEGDTGIYVWNLWVFSHEILSSGTTPLRTLEILPLAGPTDLSLHNYTVFADLLAMPLLPWLGIIKTFNVVYLINCALAGFGLFLLARHLTGRTAESVIAGLMFAWAPYLVTRGSGHYSLAAAAPLPIFMLMLYRAWESHRLRDAIGAGAVLAWAAFCDPYYAVYCVMLGACFVGSRLIDVSLVRRPVHELRGAKNLLHVAIAAIAVLVVVVHYLGHGVVQVGAFRVTMRTLYTPMLLLTVLALVRLAVSTNLRLTPLPVPSRQFMLRATIACVVMAAVLMSPTLYAVGLRILENRMTSEPVLWRSSAHGVDLLAFLLPNPNHPLAPAAIRDWLAARPGAFEEQVASLSWIGGLVMLVAWRVAGFRAGRLWLGITLAFGLMSMGPFLQIAGLNTQIPGPWAILRYAPLIGAARMPGRLSIVVMLGFCVLFAFALAAIGRRFPQRRPLILSVVALLLAIELVPAPRHLFAAHMPAVYQTIAADPRDVRVLTLPTGVRDGLSSMGNYSAASQFYQALHGKGLIGGYLSRVSTQRKQFYRRAPVTSALIEISEGRKLTRAQVDRAIAGADDFLRVTNLGYVVIKREPATADIRDFAGVVLGLRKIAEADGYELYVPKGAERPPAARVP